MAGPWLFLQCVTTATYPLPTPTLRLRRHFPPQKPPQTLQHPTCSQAETNSCISQMSLVKRRPVTVTTWFMSLVYALPNGPDPAISTQGSFIRPLLVGHFLGCKNHASGATALFSARENASSCARLVPRSDCTLTLIYHPLTLISVCFFSKPSTDE